MNRQFSALLVEDELQILNGMRGALSSGVPEILDVYTATNGSMALDVLRDKAPDFVVTDLCMPVMGGVELVQHMRREGFMQPVVVLTALEDFKTAQTMILCQIENYIVKPFSMQDILKEAHKIIQKLQLSQDMKRARVLLDTQPDIVAEIGEKGTNSLVLDAKNHIAAHLHEGLSLQAMADTLHISKTYLSTLFKRETGKTINEYITAKRLKEAKTLLLETELRIGEICERVGYQSDKYFIQVFREHEGTTPMAFRLNVRRQLGKRG